MEYLNQKEQKFYIDFYDFNKNIKNDNVTDELCEFLNKQVKNIHFLKYNNEQVNFDLDNFRKIKLSFYSSDIRKWYYYLPPYFDLPMKFDRKVLTEITPDYTFKDKILICITEKTINPFIDIKLINEHVDKCVFIGLENEYISFSNYFNINIPFFECNDLFKLQQYQLGAKCFIAGQSGNYSIQECSKQNRLLLECQFVLNEKNDVIIGPNNNFAIKGNNEFCHSVINTDGFNFFFNKLI